MFSPLDRYVILGNHRDSWGFGAVDPSGGTAIMLEIVRVFAKAMQRGWKPKRTIVFSSWGAEEYGLIGSTEWVEEFQKALTFRAVAYLNVDIAVEGNYSFGMLSNPMLLKTVQMATKFTPDPYDSSINVYDKWLRNFGGL